MLPHCPVLSFCSCYSLLLTLGQTNDVDDDEDPAVKMFQSFSIGVGPFILDNRSVHEYQPVSIC